jgi:hypothetical protein
VRNGILHSFGEVVMFTDADLSAPIEEAEGLFAAIAAGADIAIFRWNALLGRCNKQVERIPRAGLAK